jgi:hypothetical protein
VKIFIKAICQVGIDTPACRIAQINGWTPHQGLVLSLVVHPCFGVGVQVQNIFLKKTVQDVIHHAHCPVLSLR